MNIFVNSRQFVWFWVLACFCFGSRFAFSNTYDIGPSQSWKKLSDVVGRLEAGDRVRIHPGTYKDVCKIKAKGTADKPIVIKGVGETMPVFDAEGMNVSGRGPIPRAILQIEGSHIIIENLELKNARNGNNGAGIRLLQSKFATLRNCRIHHCDMGIQGGDRERVLIEHCDIGFNSTSEHNGYAHNFYMLGNRVTVRHCYIHDSLYGQNYKSRAHYNALFYNWIVDSNEGEIGPVDGKGATDRPNSHTVMIGNVIVSKPNRTGNNAKYILMGSELGGSHVGTLFMFFNVLIAGDPKIKFIQLDDPQTDCVAKYNIFYGSEQILKKRDAKSEARGGHNWFPKTAAIPSGFTDSLTGRQPGFYDVGQRDFRLKPNSPFWRFQATRIEYIDGDGKREARDIDLHALQKYWKEHPKIKMEETTSGIGMFMLE
ncbi:hypothetical protein GF373_12135 [bacterium]|nr:hypothetical protein [bacterium]